MDEGRSLKLNEIETIHCIKMGEIVAEIHMTNFSELDIHNDCSTSTQLTNWNQYLHQGQNNNSVWVNLLRENVDQLYKWNSQANHSAELFLSNMVISHCDLDSKNVMWNQDSPIVIDWEASGYINPMQNLTDTAIYWSENEAGDIDKERFLAFLDGYKKKCGTLHANWKAVLEYGFLGKLGWLEYSLKWFISTISFSHIFPRLASLSPISMTYRISLEEAVASDFFIFRLLVSILVRTPLALSNAAD